MLKISLITGLALIVILLILYIAGNKSVHVEITIEAPPDKVWKVLTDHAEIKEWNKILIPLDGQFKEGTTIKYEFNQDENSSTTMPAKVIRIIENQLLNQSGGMMGVLIFDHNYILEPSGKGTKLTIHEDYKGIMVPFWNPVKVEAAYMRLAEALRQRVLSLEIR